jgi:hypothetical protein
VKVSIFGLILAFGLAAAPAPQLVKQGTKYTLLVDGKPYIVLGAQVNNSSGWPDRLETLWPAAESLHLNTLEVPVYWEDIEPQSGSFHFATVDRIIEQARAHHMRLVLLWFGTWKNGTMDYVPSWVKADPAKYPHMLDSGGHAVRVLTPHSETNLAADKLAFSALMKHLREVDGDLHTVILVQVENEPGSLGTDRDHSAAANQLFAGRAPEALISALHWHPGTWTEVFGGEADEAFAAYYVSRYVNEVAAGGKQAYQLPLYVNVWLREQKNFMRPGEAYPSGGATSNMLNLWKANTPSIDFIAPDNYLLDYVNYRGVMGMYHRDDNALMIPETGGPRFPSNMFYALGDFDALGFAPFGLDMAVKDGKVREEVQPFADNCRLLEPALPLIASLQGTGRLFAAVEEAHLTEKLIIMEKYDVLVQFGTPHMEYGGIFGTQTPKLSGRALVAQIEPDEFIVMGFDARVDFRPGRSSKFQNAQFLRVEEGTFVNGEWKVSRLLNGDEAFFGFFLPPGGVIIRAKLTRY